MKTALVAAAAAYTLLIGCSSGPDRNADGSFATSRNNISALALHCEVNKIKPVLKDPNSYRRAGHTFTDSARHITVQVNYTATNSFGGRVSDSKTCRYDR